MRPKHGYVWISIKKKKKKNEEKGGVEWTKDS
jgi:hypothetical protein